MIRKLVAYVILGINMQGKKFLSFRSVITKVRNIG